jgi:hypothetical protein
MTKRKKLIVGALVVLGAYYLYNKYKVKNEVEDLKEGADYPAPPTPLPPSTTTPTPTPEEIAKKTADCEKKWQDEIGIVSKLSAEAREKSKSEYVKTCLESK